MIEVKDVVAGYNAEVDILRGMTLHAEQKEIVTLLGPNGCGKSTLLKTIAGYLLPRKGQVLLQGQDVSRVPVHQKVRRCRLGFVPQTDTVFASLSIRENHHVGEYYQSKEDNQRCIGPCLMSELTTVLGIIPVAG